MNKKFVISLGGSVLVPDGINIKLLKDFCSLIKKEVKKDNKFVIIVGGGGLCRKYQKAAEKAARAAADDRDWIGIATTHLNAQLLRICLGKIASCDILTKPSQTGKFGKYSVIVGGGWKPGWSTDFVAVKAAVDFKIDKVINLGKPHYVYTADPSKYKSAKPIPKLTWAEYLKIIPSKWTPGLSTPFDPVAARSAKKHNKQVIVADGKNLKNFQNILIAKKFKGTTIT